MIKEHYNNKLHYYPFTSELKDYCGNYDFSELAGTPTFSENGVNLNSAAIRATSDFYTVKEATYVMWVNMSADTTYPSGNRYSALLFDFGYNSTTMVNRVWIAFWKAGTYTLKIAAQYYVPATSSVTYAVQTSNYSINTWYKIAVVLSTNNMKLYINDTLQQSVTIVYPMTTPTQNYIKLGEETDLVRSFHGNVKGLHIFNRALSLNDIINVIP